MASRHTPTPWPSSVTSGRSLDAMASAETQPELEPLELPSDSAEQVIEALRFGLPPAGYVRHFTVGRQEELRRLDHDLHEGMHGKAILVRANYGAGKSHLLNLVRDL